MQASLVLQPLLLFCLVARGIDAYVYSCEEAKYRLINSNFELNTTFACVFTQEGYWWFDQLEKVSFAGYSTTLADIAEPSGCMTRKSSEPQWRLIMDPSWNLDCREAWTLVFTNDIPTFQSPTKTPRSRRITSRETFVQPWNFVWFRTEDCEGEGNITFYTGSGLGEQEERYALRSFQCWDMPNVIISFDVVNTISVDDGVAFSVLFSNDPGYSKYPVRLEKGDNAVFLTSGRADDIQNCNGRDTRAYFEIGDWDKSDITMDMKIKLDPNNHGALVVQKEWGGWTYNYDNGYSHEAWNSDYFEVRYQTYKDAPEIWNSQDSIDVDIWILPKRVRTPPSTTTRMTTARPTTTPKLVGDDSYCKCGVDKFGAPVDWKYNDIWLDVVVILDTSEAMGAASLVQATGLIESFIGDANDNVDFLITDATAPFYTRVGVIAMADKAQVLYNLNMTKNDKVQANVKKGVKQINVVDAFNEAQKMLAGSPSGINARQVIYYLSNTDPTVNLNPISPFKTKGIVIVNNFLPAGELEKNGLKDLASTGYFFSDTNYMFTLQSFCKANCFCKPNKDALAGTDPASPSAGGCYRSSSAAAPFSKAKSACSTDGGIIAVVHDDYKGQFVNQQMAKAGTKSDYYWIGYEKSNDNLWRWDDQSTDPYTNWDVNEPSSASVANCAYVDKSKTNLPWGASNCQVGFPYVCEFPPCSTGNKNC